MASSWSARFESTPRTIADVRCAGVVKTTCSATIARPPASSTCQVPACREMFVIARPVSSLEPMRSASFPVSVPSPRAKLRSFARPAPPLRRASAARKRLPCVRSHSTRMGNCERTESALLSPAEMPDTAVSTSTSATSRPKRRSAKAKTVSSRSGGAGAAHGSRISRSLADQLTTVDFSNAGGESGTSASSPRRRTNRRRAAVLASTSVGVNPSSSTNAIVSGSRSRKPFGPASITQPSSSIVRACPPASAAASSTTMSGLTPSRAASASRVKARVSPVMPPPATITRGAVIPSG